VPCRPIRRQPWRLPSPALAETKVFPSPVVIYTQPPKLEGGGYRVTGLLDRDAYNAYTRSDEPGFFETAAGKALIGLGALAVVYGLTRGSGKSSPSS
jgi:hypothetical protein